MVSDFVERMNVKVRRSIWDGASLNVEFIHNYITWLYSSRLLKSFSLMKSFQSNETIKERIE